MIDSQREHLLTFSAAAREAPNRQSARGVNVSTVWRWNFRGVRGVKLESLLCGGVRYTSREALQRFFERTTAAADGRPPVASSSRQHQRAIEEAERFLASEGISSPPKATTAAIPRQHQFHG